MSSRQGGVGVRGVLFDFGYTLFSHAPLADTIGDCAHHLGAPLSDDQAVALAARIDAAAMTPEELRHPRDLDASVWAQRWKVLYGIADEVVGGLGDAVYRAMHDPLQWVPYKETAETLRALSRHGIAIGIISNTGWDVREVFSAHSCSDAIASFTLSYEIGLVKPDRQIFREACYRLEVVSGDVLMVGDDPRSDGGAVSAGIRTLLLPPALPPGTDNGVRAVLDLVGIDE
ncbi:MAG: HAD family hydrolase [Ilumatobacteraceae bacterium]